MLFVQQITLLLFSCKRTAYMTVTVTLSVTIHLVVVLPLGGLAAKLRNNNLIPGLRTVSNTPQRVMLYPNGYSWPLLTGTSTHWHPGNLIPVANFSERVWQHHHVQQSTSPLQTQTNRCAHSVSTVHNHIKEI